MTKLKPRRTQAYGVVHGVSRSSSALLLKLAETWASNSEIEISTRCKFYLDPSWTDAFAALSLGSLAPHGERVSYCTNRSALQRDADAMASDFRRLVVKSYVNSKKSAAAL
jgi:hypothetical protein